MSARVSLGDPRPTSLAPNGPIRRLNRASSPPFASRSLHSRRHAVIGALRCDWRGALVSGLAIRRQLIVKYRPVHEFQNISKITGLTVMQLQLQVQRM